MTRTFQLNGADTVGVSAAGGTRRWRAVTTMDHPARHPVPRPRADDGPRRGEVAGGARPGGLPVPAVDAGEVAARLVELALGEPAGLVPDLAGPRDRLGEQVQQPRLGGRIHPARNPAT